MERNFADSFAIVYLNNYLPLLSYFTKSWTYPFHTFALSFLQTSISTLILFISETKLEKKSNDWDQDSKIELVI